MDRNELRKRIIDSEGYRQIPYRDHLGNWTVGYGTLIKGWPLRKLNVGELLDYLTDKENHKLWLDQAIEEAVKTAGLYAGLYAGSYDFSLWDRLTPLRQMVLVEMAYQLGAGGLNGFVRLEIALRAQDYDDAAAEMLDSRWAKQTPERADAPE